MQKKTAIYFLFLFTSAFLFFQSVSFAQSSNWQQLASPCYESVYSISAAPNGNLWTATGNGVYMSTDQGDTWKRMKGIPYINFGKVDVNPNNGDIFVTCEDPSIYRSTDNGQSWDSIHLGQDLGPVECIVFNSNGEIVGYSRSTNTIFVSSNRGINWTKKGTMIDNVAILHMAVTKSGNYVASTQLGIYRSTDSGSSWTCVSQSLPKQNYYVVEMAKDGTLFTGTQSKIYSSTDDGQSWQLSFITGSGLSISSIVADSSGNVWACDTYGLYRTINSGKNWFRVSTDLHSNGIKDLTSDLSGNLFAGSEHGILMSTNAGNEWISKSEGINNSKCDVIKLAPDGTLYTLYLNSLYISTNCGTSWKKTPTNFNPHEIECISIDAKGNLYAGSDGRIGISTDRGNSWEIIAVGDNNTHFTSIAFDADGVIYAGSGIGLYRSLDNGKTWNLLYRVPSGYKTQVAINRNKDIFFAVNRAVYKSTDNGATWTKRTPSIEADVKTLMINHKGYIYFGTDYSGLIYSTDNGENWQSVQVGGPVYFPMIYTMQEAHSGIIYTNTSNGYYYSDNDGQTWTLIDKEEERGGNILDMIIDKNGYIYATTAGDGFIKSNQSLLKILPPETINIKIGDKKAYLSWNKNASPNFSKYNIYGSYDHYPSILIDMAIGGANDTTKLVNNLTNLKYYYMVISAVDNQGNESFSDEVSIKPIPLPDAPTQVEVANGLTKAKTTQSFKWTRPMCGDLYTLEISQDSTFKTSFYSDSTLTDTVKQVGGFAHSTKYFWQVKSKSISGWGSWSNVWTFTTIIAPPSAPVAIQPSINALNQAVNQTFKWNKLPTAESYYFQLSKAQDFTSSIVFEDSTLTDTLKAFGPLENDTKYYWRLRGKNEGGIGAWTTALSFTTIVAPPEVALLSSPLNNAQAQPRDITLKWLKAKRAGQYFFQLASDSLFNDLIISDSIVTDTCKTVMQLSYNSKYYWKVKSVNVGGVSLWSSVFSFIVMKERPNSPLLISPMDKSINQPIKLALSWKPLVLAENYHVQLSDKPDFSSLIINDSTLTDTSKQALSLKNNMKYYWRLRAKNNGGTGLWSEAWTFTTIVAIPNAPVQSYPGNNSRKITKDVKLTWGQIPDAESYRLQIAEDSLFTKKIFDDSTVTSAGKDVSLNSGMKYFWKVNAKNLAGLSNYSQIWNFVTVLPVCENLNTTSIAAWIVKLNWTDKSDNETSYVLERKSEKDVSYKVRATLAANSVAYTDTTSPSTTYKYRIKAYNQFTESDYSNELTITTPIATSVDDTKEIPLEYALQQNYPNPFNPSTMIKYSVLNESHVKLSVYSSIGALVEVVTDKIQASGVYEERFDAEKLSSGIYYYMITIQSTDGKDNFRSVKKMMLVK